MTDGFLEPGFLGDLFRVILEVGMALAGIIMTPFAALIAAALPTFNDALLQVPVLFELITGYVGWVISMLAIPPIVVLLVVGYLTTIITIKLAAYPLKLILSWWVALKP